MSPTGEPASGAPTIRAAAAHTPPVHLVRWHGPVEHLFFHTLVIHPRQAFRHDALGRPEEVHPMGADPRLAAKEGQARGAHRVQEPLLQRGLRPRRAQLVAAEQRAKGSRPRT